MTSICFYFQAHQPYRLKGRRTFDLFAAPHLFDDQGNRAILEKVAHKCYLPANQLMLDLIKRGAGRFRIAYSITGVLLDQMADYAPVVLDSFKRLVDTGHVELLGETYYHSLASLYDQREFFAQVDQHADTMYHLFGARPRVFRNTELIYDDRIGTMLADRKYDAVIAEGVDDVLDWRSPNFVYQIPNTNTRLLLKNYRLSDDIAFRFSNQAWQHFPLTADKFAHWVHAHSGAGQIINLFMDYETFGEHQWESTGIFQFLNHLPEAVLRQPDWEFCTPTEAVQKYDPIADLSFGRLTSWADMDRDLTAWRGNQMQQRALQEIYMLTSLIRRCDDKSLTDTWRRLQTSDHYYYMCTKWFSDGDVHAYFSPFESPYDAFVSFMNAMEDLKQVATAKLASSSQQDVQTQRKVA